MITGLHRAYHAYHFICSFTLYLLFISCGRPSWLPVSFLLHVKYTLSYRIVLYLQLPLPIANMWTSWLRSNIFSFVVSAHHPLWTLTISVMGHWGHPAGCCWISHIELPRHDTAFLFINSHIQSKTRFNLFDNSRNYGIRLKK